MFRPLPVRNRRQGSVFMLLRRFLLAIACAALVLMPATAWPIARAQDGPEDCEPERYPGIQHCTRGAAHILRIDPAHPQVRFETVLPLGYDRDGDFGECRDVNVPRRSTGPGCHVDGRYPGELVGDMARRYPGAVAAFNADFFSFPEYRHGPEGLTVKNGERLDGLFGDHDGNEVRRGSLSISRDGEVRIGIVAREDLPNLLTPWTWQPDPVAFHTTVGGLPLLVRDGWRVHIGDQCLAEGSDECPAPYAPRGRTAVGVTRRGELIVVVITDTPEAALTLGQLGDLMVDLGAVDALNLDGGGSSQLWYDGYDLVFSPRPVVEALLVFADSATPSAR